MTLRRRIGHDRRGGFTLVEAIAVLLLLGVLVLIMTSTSFNSSADLVAEVDQLRGHLRFVQSLAMANNVDSWGIAVSAGGYTLRKNGSVAPIDLPGLGTATHVFTAGVSVIGGTGVVAFDEFGRPVGAAVTITLSDGTHTRVIIMDAETGYQS